MTTTHSGDTADTQALPESLPLGILDFLNFSEALSADAKRQNAINTALLADRLGYRRFWIPEHHAAGVPSTNPLMLLPVLGNLTHRVRLGPAVTLIRVRDPHLVAEDLATASFFCRDRLDVGLGRGDVAGGAAQHLPRLKNEELDGATARVYELIEGSADWLDPVQGTYQAWMHGAGRHSGAVAGNLGLNYCHAYFFNPDLQQAAETLAAHADACPEQTRAVAVGLVINDDFHRAAREAEQPGIRISLAGPARAAADLILELLSDDLVDEVIVTEHSMSPADHTAALTSLADLVGQELATSQASIASGD